MSGANESLDKIRRKLDEIQDEVKKGNIGLVLV